MSEADFWNYLEEAGKEEYDLQKIMVNLKEALSKSALSELISFEIILRSKIRALFLPKIGEIFLVTTSKHKKSKLRYISNDGFIDFRAWIVGNGKWFFEHFLNFKSEEELIGFELHPNYAYNEDLVGLTNLILKEQQQTKQIRIDDFIEESKNEREGDSIWSGVYDGNRTTFYEKIEWENLALKYPEIYQKYQRN